MTGDNVKERKTGENFTLKDSQTSLYIHLKSDKTEVKVDEGIIKNINSGERK